MSSRKGSKSSGIGGVFGKIKDKTKAAAHKTVDVTKSAGKIITPGSSTPEKEENNPYQIKEFQMSDEGVYENSPAHQGVPVNYYAPPGDLDDIGTAISKSDASKVEPEGSAASGKNKRKKNKK